MIPSFPRARRLIAAAALLAGLLGAAPVHAISRGLDRITTESPHFAVTVDRSQKAMAAEAAAWLEQAYALQAEFFDFRPAGRMDVVLLDDEDYSNGFAYAANSWIVLHLPPARFDLRGPARWMPNVAAHELGHVITLRKMNAARRFFGVDAFVSLGRRHSRLDGEAAWVNGEAPAWLAEGLAQYASMHCGHDTLDAHRTMLLRQAWLSGSLLPLKAMETFSGDARDGETVYNQGFHLVDFLYRTHGRDAVNAMMTHWGEHGYQGAFVRAFGETPIAVYGKWRAELDARFAAAGTAGAEKPAPIGPTYAVETSPFYDAATRTLYYLSSRGNDFGITHLYASRGGRTRLVRRDVNPPLRAGAGGTVLFTSSRTEASSGARISDLYRLRPKDGTIERLTRGQRVIGAAEFTGRTAGSKGPPYVLIQHKGRPRLARLSRRGTPARWYDAPAGSEFTDLAAGDSLLLYVGVVRGKNADILGMDTAGRFLPVAATPRNETDPFARGGRVFFSAEYDDARDAAGGRAIYSTGAQGADSLLRHTPPGKPAFAPFASGDSLFYSEYAAPGFRVRALPLTGQVTVAPAGAMPADPATAFIPPPVPPLKKYANDRTSMGLLGYFGTVGYAFTPHVDVTAEFGPEENVYRFNPCPQQGYLGGGILWSDPSLRSQLILAGLAGQCVDEGFGRGTSVPYAVADYLNQNFSADILVTGVYQSTLLERRGYFNSLADRGALHDFTIIGGGMWSFGNYIQNLAFGIVGASILNLPRDEENEEEILQGAALGLGNTLAVAVVEPGDDFVNEGGYGTATVVVLPGAILTASDAGVYANAGRALFVGAHADVLQVIPYPETFSGGWSATADYRIPLGFAVGTAGYRGFFFESLFLRAGFAWRWNTESGVGLSTNPGQGLRAFQAVRERERARLTGLEGAGGNGLVPVVQVQNLSPQTLRAGVRLKAISTGSRVVYWDAQWQAPPDRPGDGYFSLALSL
jgi:hypothetical protein